MRKKLFIPLILISSSLFSQLAPSKYWVRFKDRSGTPYSTSSPSAYLSQRAIDRRTNQGIAIIENDLPVNPTYVAGVQATGVSVLNRSKWFNSLIVYTTDTNKIKTIKTLPYVLSVSPVARIKKKSTDDEVQGKFTNEFLYAGKVSRENPPFSTQAYDYGQGLNQASMIGCDCMHNKGYDGKGMVIAIIDAGFYSADTIHAFDSLWNNNQVLGTWDFVAGNANVFEDHQHGMHVLSTIAANWPGQLVGTAPKASFWLLRSEDAPTEYLIEEHNWTSAAEFADSVGADIFNTSLGYTTFDDTTQNHKRADMDGNTNVISVATNIAASKGIIPVCAAGNEGGGSWFYISSPADADSALTIGAVDGNKAYVGFSSKGPNADGQIKPTIATQGAGTSVIATDGTVVQGSGTSFASPVAAGGVAILWQAHPLRTNMQIYNAIIQSADRYLNPDSLTGYGIPNFCTADLILTGLENKLAGKFALKVFPNPFSDHIEIVFMGELGEGTEINLYDISGKLLLKQHHSGRATSINKILLPTPSTMAKGLYLLTVENKGQVYSYKLNKQ